jgi:hypothetical protein
VLADLQIVAGSGCGEVERSVFLRSERFDLYAAFNLALFLECLSVSLASASRRAGEPNATDLEIVRVIGALRWLIDGQSNLLRASMKFRKSTGWIFFRKRWRPLPVTM